MNRFVAGVLAAMTLALLALLLNNSRLSDRATIAELEALELRVAIERTTEANVAYQQSHQRDTQSLSAMDRKIKELEAYVSALPDGADQCLSPADADRLRGLWP